MQFGKVYFHGRGLSILGEESFLWSGLLTKSKLRQLLEHALEGEPSSWEQQRVLERAASQR